MISRLDLQTYLADLLVCSQYNDYAPNGLQVQGAAKIKVICTAVTASLAVIEQAINMQANALLVHHGYFWRGEDLAITGIKHQRIAKLINHDINLFAYHLPLDGHPQLGNNAMLGKLFGLTELTMHAINGQKNLLWSGSFAVSKTSQEMVQFLTEKLNRKPLWLAGKKETIQQLAWCSGAAQDYIGQAHALGADAYLSGEVSERTYHEAKELGIHYFAGGHHATERLGIQALGNHLAAAFNLEHQFIDSDNPI